jgi:glycosyltransferase involved in cell wall biosynthesis
MKERNYPRLVLITPARNEEAHITKTLEAVSTQTITPLKWLIVSDGSTDRTESIVEDFTRRYAWIELIRLPEHRDRSFAAKVTAFNTAYQQLAGVDYDVIGNLDGDISFAPTYLEFLLKQFERIPGLGVAGTPFIEPGYSSYADSYEGEQHVPGGCQLFRRACFEDIGGYKPVRGGGIDWIAVTTARMRGWRTRSFTEMHFVHYRPLGTGGRGRLGAFLDYGYKDYYLGGHPLWQLFRVLYRMTRKPYVIGGVLLLTGYLKGFFRNVRRPVSKELMQFHRSEQKKKLLRIFSALLRFRRVDKFRLVS